MQKRDAESESEGEDGEDEVPKLDIDVTKLTPLSPEVISKQVRYTHALDSALYSCTIGHDQLGYESLDSVDTGASSFLIGTIGHVAHGKSTVVKAISGVMTVRFKNELVRNITIKLGYANAKVRTHSQIFYDMQ